MPRDLDVLVVGDLNPDLILRGDVVPRFGQSEQLLDSADLTIGGSGAIVAHGLARLGRRVALAAVIGADPFGVLMRDRLSAAGVDTTTLIEDAEQPTGLTVVLNHGSSRTMLTLIGAIGALDPARIDDTLLARTTHLHATSFFLQPRFAGGLAGLFARARAAGVSTSLDTNIDPADRWEGLDEVLPLTDVLLPNRTEILGLAAHYDPPRTDDAVAAARAIARRGPVVVVKDGEKGAFAVSPDGEVVHRKGHPVEAIDSTGAGDSFDAGFLAARRAGRSLPGCLDAACRAGALSTQGIGGTATQPTAAEIGL